MNKNINENILTISRYILHTIFVIILVIIIYNVIKFQSINFDGGDDHIIKKSFTIWWFIVSILRWGFLIMLGLIIGLMKYLFSRENNTKFFSATTKAYLKLIVYGVFLYILLIYSWFISGAISDIINIF